MLHILEDNDPTLRLSCKSWLSESSSAFRRILDPLLEEFLDNSKIYVTFTGSVFFLENYETKIVIHNFSKLRNIILNTHEEIIQYMLKEKASEFIDKHFDIVFNYIRPRKTAAGAVIPIKKNYLHLIVYITLEFIMG